MDRKYWLERWIHDQIGFHQPDHNPWLVKYWPALDLAPGSTVFVPMCGKSLDLRWVAEQGCRVVGVDFARIAIEAFFEESSEPYELVPGPNLPCYRGERVEIYCGDFFELTAHEVAETNGVFDRAALVALPPPMRPRYADHLLRIIPEGARTLLVTCEYDDRLVAGPPFTVFSDEVERLYGERCRIAVLEGGATESVPPHFQAQGVTCMGERVYHLEKVA
jgi:thiopurine S-methyltransferase